MNQTNEETIKYQAMAQAVHKPSSSQSPAFTGVVSNGEKKTFPTGAQREVPTGKGRFDLIPAYPLMRLAAHYENGAVRYSDRNWEKGLPLSSFLGSTFRHIVKYMGGDRSEDHWAAIAWNAFAFMHTEEMIRLGRLPKTLADFPLEGPLTMPTSNDTNP